MLEPRYRPAPAMAPPKVSVIMAVYNEERYLSAALRSLIAQTFTDWDCLIVNDSSTDSSGVILQQYAEHDARFSVIVNQRNRGLPASLNTAITGVRGDYVARMDADDLCLPERFEQQVAFLDTHPEVTVLGTAAIFIDECGAVLRDVRLPEQHERIVAEIPRRNPLIHPTVMMRRAALVRAGGYCSHQRHAQDLELWARGAALGWRFHNLPERLLLYRSQPLSHPPHTWTTITLLVRNGFAHGYPWRGIFWAFVGLAESILRAACVWAGGGPRRHKSGETPAVGGRRSSKLEPHAESAASLMEEDH